MDIAPLPAPVSNPAPSASAEPPRERDGAPSFAERLDEQSGARHAKQAARLEKKTAATDQAPAPATAQAPVDDATMTVESSGKGANPGTRLEDSAAALASEKVADDAATDPAAVMTQMLQGLTAPAQAAPNAPKAPAGGVEATAKPDPREALATAAKAGAEAAEAAAKTDGDDTASAPADDAAATADMPPAPAPTADNSQVATAGTGTPVVTPPPSPHGHEAAAPARHPCPLPPRPWA
ncbi:hypothetical protein D3874_01865 [Oleomonas cavernae]|uniref:Uncharacterized protein n=1 Tax=Oleomonas cavernae TaxID=2320859 RepID=A0A418WTK9_9PROT|nr:hypothetical protein [Oleomonas cavernae]RJF94602.1 hypothetical protein D3874_01865 [Oleomonas cavernae]